jgi:hypothetical protein
MMRETLLATSSPESVPSLSALSQASTDGDDSPNKATTSENKADSSINQSSTLDTDASSWHAMLDDDDDVGGKSSTCSSSGILSAESLDLNFEPMEQEEEGSLHSLASMLTIKSPIGRMRRESLQADKPDPASFERVDAEDIPIDRACHGALGISPRQLADVFALFARESKSQQTSATPVSPQSELQGEGSMSPPAPEPYHDYPLTMEERYSHVRATPVSPQTAWQGEVPMPSPTPIPYQDHPLTMEERYRYVRARGGKQPSLTAELYWKPRAQSLERECETLKEILNDDSNKMLQLKGALNTLRTDKLRSLVELKSVKEHLESTRQELDTLKEEHELTRAELDSLEREREMLLEHQTEYHETIRILKQEVDLLTGGELSATEKPSPPVRRNTAEENELVQLRLENQLFATQIVDYEAELVRLEQQVQSTTGKQQEDTREALRAMELAQRISHLEHLSRQQAAELGANPSDLKGTVQCLTQEPSPEEQNPPNVEITLSNHEPVTAVVITAPTPGEDTASLGDEVGMKSTAANDCAMVEEVTGSVADGDIADASLDKQSTPSAGESTTETRYFDSALGGVTSDFPQQILGTVLGMFGAVGSADEGKENAKHGVLVLQDASTTYASSDDIHCLQWNSPGQLPTIVKVNRVALSENEEDLNLTPAFNPSPLGDKTNVLSSSMHSFRKMLQGSRGGRDDTAIDVIQNYDASQSIEVQLTGPDKGKPPSGSVQPTREDKCDFWHALSNCPFLSDHTY